MINYETFRLTYNQTSALMNRAKDRVLEHLYAPIYYSHGEANAWTAGFRFAVNQHHQIMIHELHEEARRQEAQEAP